MAQPPSAPQIKDIPRLAERIKCFIFSRTYKATHAKVRMLGQRQAVQGWGALPLLSAAQPDRLHATGASMRINPLNCT